MADKNYLYAVAVIRANEASLLKEQDLEQILGAPDYKKAVSLLCDKGYEEPKGNDYSAMLDGEIEKTWKLLRENAPDADELNTFIVKNDFQNLKACLKAEVADLNPKVFLVRPSVIDPDTLLECVSKREFDELPEFISEAAEKAFDTVTKTGNGQLCDVIIDTAAMKAMRYFAGLSDEDILKEYADVFCLATDIKTAYRCAKTKKGESFIEAALAETPFIDKKVLTEAALEGEEAVIGALEENGLSDYARALTDGASQFEKYCDDRLLNVVKKAKYISIGISPLAAYYVARETEVKALRIILSAKISGASNETVRERMRELYV